MQQRPDQQAAQRRSRWILAAFLLVALVASIAAALMIQRGLSDEELQDQLRDLREQQR
jgi:hypothetical protein